MVSYIQRSGVNALRAEISRLCQSGGVRLICSFDMGITDPEAVRELKNIGAEIKIFQAKRGSFHPKVWLFENPDTKLNCLVGSANFTAGGLFDNTEVGVLLENGEVATQAQNLFNRLWNGKNCQFVDDQDLDQWSEKKRRREAVNRKIAAATSKQDQTESVNVLEEFVFSWIDIGVGRMTEGAGKIDSRLWRGWYIIPDQGEIDAEAIDRLMSICRIIAEQSSGQLVSSSEDVGGDALASILQITTAKLKRPNRKTSDRALFVRQEKNYLVHLGLADAVGRSTIALTRYGWELAQNSENAKHIYTEAMDGYRHNGLELLKFLRRLLMRTQRLDFIEFSFFACHAWTLDEVDMVASMVEIYRGMSPDLRREFVERMDAYFAKKLSQTGSGVKMNYDKSVRHTMSALGWCEGLRYVRHGTTKAEIFLDDSV